MSAVEQYDATRDLDHVAATLRQWEGREVFVRAVSDTGCEAWVDEIVAESVLYFDSDEDADPNSPLDTCLVFHLAVTEHKVSGYRRATKIAKVERTTITLQFDGGPIYTIALLAQA